MGRWFSKKGVGSRKLAAALMISASFGTVLLSASKPVMAQTIAQRTYSIPAGPLSQALALFGRQSGLQVTYPAEIAGGRQSPGMNGAATPEQALARILNGSGLTYSFSGARTVVISRRGADGGSSAASVPGAIPLDAIDVGGAQVKPDEVPYQIPAPVNVITAETIDHFRGSSPADIFRGTPGVMSGEARNGAGSLDVNIRGMQGMGRVAVTVDGTTNSTTVYQGYQGISNRTFVDPDLLADINIRKGSDASSPGIAGTVAMRTVDAGDIVKPGNQFGFRVKGGFGTNTGTPLPTSSLGGYNFPSFEWLPPVAVPTTTLNRPDLLQPTSGFGSAVGAMKTENVDLLFGYAQRDRGNYYAGSHGPSANPVNTGPRQTCMYQDPFPPICRNWTDYVDNAGVANYLPGQQVLNTELHTKNWLGKGEFRFGDGQSVKLTYNGYHSEAGDVLASRLTDTRIQPAQQRRTAGSYLHSGSAQYKWKPSDHPLIDLTANLWLSDLKMRNLRRNSANPTPQSLGLPADFRTGTNTMMWGSDVTNKSAFSTKFGRIAFTSGLYYLNEDTRPSAYTIPLEGTYVPRDARRQEAAAFTKASWDITRWLNINGGLRYQHYWSVDRAQGLKLSGPPQFFIPGYSTAQGGLSPSVGVTVKPWDGVQLYANYSNALRMPSIMEASTSLGMIVNSAIRPERASNWDFGVNLHRNGIFDASDRGMVKLGYFDWTINNYIGRRYIVPNLSAPTDRWGLLIFNMHQAHFSGFEFNARYEWKGFTADLAANYYTDVRFCQTADNCTNASFYGDYATNQVPPKYVVYLTLSQKLLEDRLTIGGRLTHVSTRAVPHAPTTAQGASPFIALVDWRPYTLVDLFAQYKLSEWLTAEVRVENLTDRFYVDPLSLVIQPAPGRTIYGSLTAHF